MPRTEARILCSIWDNDEFLALPMDAQWLYLAIISQPGMSQAGVVLIPRREWANLVPDDDAADRIATARKALEGARFVVVDERTDEVLVRTFIRHDIVGGAPGMFRAAMDAALAVRSRVLRSVLREELLRLDTAVIEAKKAGRNQLPPIEAYRRALAALEPGPNGPEGSPESATQTLFNAPAAEAPAEPSHGMTHPMTHPMKSHGMSHGMAHTPGDGVGDGASPTPQEPTPTELPHASGETALAVPLSENKRAQALTRRYHEHVPLSNFPAVMKIVKRAIRTQLYADDVIQAALERLAGDGRSVTTDSLRTELEGLPRSRHSKPTTRDHVASALVHLQPDPEQGTAS